MQKLTKNLSGDEGMTLIELIVVVAIIAVTAGIIFPVWSRYARDQDIKLEAEKIANDMRLSRNKALNNEQAEFVNRTDYSILAYYFYINEAPSYTSPTQTNGVNTYEIRRLLRRTSDGQLSVDTFKTANTISNVKIYRGQAARIDSTCFNLPFGKAGFYPDQPTTETGKVTTISGCPGNSGVCSTLFVKRDNVNNYYYKLVITNEGTVLLYKQP